MASTTKSCHSGNRVATNNLSDLGLEGSKFSPLPFFFFFCDAISRSRTDLIIFLTYSPASINPSSIGADIFGKGALTIRPS